METHEIAQAIKPRRPRRKTIALSVNAELCDQLDIYAREMLLTRSFLWERMALEWIERAEADE